MKTKITLLLLSLFALSCSNDETFDHTAPTPAQHTNKATPYNPKHNAANSQNNVLLLKVDYLTQTFEGGRILTFPNNPSFNLTYNYQSPSDFGSMTLLYAEVGQPIFSGTIIWMGLGAMQYPQSLWPANAFATVGDLPMPGPNDYVVIDEQQSGGYYPNPVPMSQIWDAVKNLQIVHQYRASNPNAPVRLFIYTPSVGVGNPADWDYFLLIKN